MPKVFIVLIFQSKYDVTIVNFSRFIEVRHMSKRYGVDGPQVKILIPVGQFQCLVKELNVAKLISRYNWSEINFC